jgi:hypothetical protein
MLRSVVGLHALFSAPRVSSRPSAAVDRRGPRGPASRRSTRLKPRRASDPRVIRARRAPRVAVDRRAVDYPGKDASMIGNWFGIGFPCGIALLLIVGVVQASARNPTRVLRFYDTAGVDTLVGASPSGKPTIGEEDILTLRLQNVGTQFGRPTGTTVGRALMTCTVMLVDRTQGTSRATGAWKAPDRLLRDHRRRRRLCGQPRSDQGRRPPGWELVVHGHAPRLNLVAIPGPPSRHS